LNSYGIGRSLAASEGLRIAEVEVDVERPAVVPPDDEPFHVATGDIALRLPEEGVPRDGDRLEAVAEADGY
jgi:hypothetical protein